MNADEMIEVMQAYVRGEAIKFCDLDRPDIWFDVTDTLQWARDLNSYRVKPKPSEKALVLGIQDVRRLAYQPNENDESAGAGVCRRKHRNCPALRIGF